MTKTCPVTGHRTWKSMRPDQGNLYLKMKYDQKDNIVGYRMYKCLEIIKLETTDIPQFHDRYDDVNLEVYVDLDI